MTIERAISGTVYTQLVTTTSILAKLVVCAILLASIANAQAASDDDSTRSGISRRSGAHAAQKFSGAKQRSIRETDHSNLAKLEREWERLHNGEQLAMRRRVVACLYLGQCEGLIHSIPGSALVSVSPDRNVPVAGTLPAEEQSVSTARDATAAANGSGGHGEWAFVRFPFNDQ